MTLEGIKQFFVAVDKKEKSKKRRLAKSKNQITHLAALVSLIPHALCVHLRST